MSQCSDQRPSHAQTTLSSRPCRKTLQNMTHLSHHLPTHLPRTGMAFAGSASVGRVRKNLVPLHGVSQTLGSSRSGNLSHMPSLSKPGVQKQASQLEKANVPSDPLAQALQENGDIEPDMEEEPGDNQELLEDRVCRSSFSSAGHAKKQCSEQTVHQPCLQSSVQLPVVSHASASQQCLTCPPLLYVGECAF